MSDEYTAALVPMEVRSVEFYGDELIGALVQAGAEPQIYVPIRPICDYLGLSWGSQRNRIYRDDVLRESVRGVFITNTPQAGGRQEMLCLPLEYLPGWLFGVTPTRVKPEIKEKILTYKRECYRRLWEAFKPEIMGSAQLAPAVPQSGAELAYELATAVQNLAREQIDLEQRLNRSAQWARGIEARVSALEIR
ncbi:MAG TPA: phage antirepressor N-terminal domain-containing protein, partial [Roseiflexaceae bacterium]|nr:phage antirepressor N-terminal domain-containing protein [Roseiflexaceae bacterium]